MRYGSQLQPTNECAEAENTCHHTDVQLDLGLRSEFMGKNKFFQRLLFELLAELVR